MKLLIIFVVMNYSLNVNKKVFFVLIVLIMMKSLSATILIYPNNGLVYSKGEIVNLQWESIITADSFQIQVDNSATFSNPEIDDVQLLNNREVRINSAGTHYWRIRSIVNGVFQAWSQSNNLIVVDILSMPDLTLWTKIDTGLILNGTKVVEWQDVSGNGNHISQANAIRQPVFIDSVHNNYGSVLFDGTNDFLKANSFPLNQPTTIFLVFRNEDNSNNSYYFDGNLVNSMRFSKSGGQYTLYAGSFFNTPLSFSPDYNIITSCFNGGQSFVREDLVQTTNGNPGVSSGDGFTIGGLGIITTNPVNYAKFYCSEILIFNDSLSSESIDTIEAYLKNKYAPPVNLNGNRIRYGFCNEEISPIRKDFVSYNWSTGETVDAIVVDSGLVWLEVVDSFGFTSRDSIYVFDEREIVNEVGPSINLCLNDSIVWDLGVQDNLYSFLWQNGSIDSFFVIKDSGNYWCLITDTFGCFYTTDTVLVQVDSLTLENILGEDTVLCNGTEFSFYSAQTNIDSVIWSTGEQTNEIIINTSGDYSIYVESSNGCSLRDTVNIHINGQIPSVDFLFSHACVEEVVNFTDNSIVVSPDQAALWNWSFPSGNFVQTQNSQYQFLIAGSHPIELTLTTDSGCISSKIDTIEVSAKPIANFEFDIICAETLFNLESNSYSIFPSIVDSWEWVIDGQNYVTEEVENVQLSEGSNLISLIVSNDLGCTDSTTKQVEVFPELIADFSFTNNCIGDSVIFKDETQSFSIVERNWTFNGFNTSNKKKPKFQYNTLGMQTVTLAIENAIGCKRNISKNVQISPQPVASFDYNKVCLNDTTLFFDNSIVLQDTIASSVFEIGSNLFENDSVNYVFADENSYTIIYSIKTQKFCEDDTTISLVVNPLPNPSFDFTPNYGTAPLEVSFVNETGDANNYEWSFGDAENSTDVNPSHTFTDNGIYNVTLKAINEFNCEKTNTQQIAVIPSELDLEIKKLNLEITQNGNNNIVNANVLLSNVGSRKIENADLILRLDNGDVLAQKWTGDLEIGNIIDYTFDSYFIISELSNSKYVCVEAINVNDSTELNLGNNKTCKLIDGNIQFSKPYPNPANNYVNIDVVTKEKGICNVAVVNMLGDVLLTKSSVELLKGYNQLQIETAIYQSGKYLLKVTYLEEEYVYHFIIK